MANCLTLKKSNCKNCYKCIRNCPVKAIKFSGNQAQIIGNECILCGQCFVACPQNAREIVQETEKVKVLLQSGAPVIVSLAPSFIGNYGGFFHIGKADLLQCFTHGFDADVFVICHKGRRNARNDGQTSAHKRTNNLCAVSDLFCILRTYNKATSAKNTFVLHDMCLVTRKAN